MTTNISLRQQFINENINFQRIQIKNEVAQFETSILLGSISDILNKIEIYLKELKLEFGENLIIENDYVGQHPIFVIKSVRFENDEEYQKRIKIEEKSAQNKLLTILNELNKKAISGKKLTLQEKNLLNV